MADDELNGQLLHDFTALRAGVRVALMPVWPNNFGVEDREIVAAVGDVVARAEAAEAREKALWETLAEVLLAVTCRCDAAYRSRGLHEPNSLCYLEDTVRAALAASGTAVQEELA